MARSLLTRVPDDTWEMAILGWDYEQKGMHEQAIAEFKKAVEVTEKNSPDFSPFFLAGRTILCAGWQAERCRAGPARPSGRAPEILCFAVRHRTHLHCIG